LLGVPPEMRGGVYVEMYLC